MPQKFRTKNKQNLNTHFRVPNSPNPGCNSPAADAVQPTKTNNKMATDLSKNKPRKWIVLHCALSSRALSRSPVVVGRLNDGRLERGLRQEAAETKASDEGRLERGLRQEAAETKASDKGRLERGLRQEAAETRPQTRGGSNEASDKGRLKQRPQTRGGSNEAPNERRWG